MGSSLIQKLCSDNPAVAGSAEAADQAEEEGGHQGLQRKKGPLKLYRLFQGFESVSVFADLLDPDPYFKGRSGST